MFGIMLLRDDISFKYLKYDNFKRLPSLAQNFLKSFKDIEYSSVKLLDIDTKIAYIPDCRKLRKSRLPEFKQRVLEYFNQSGVQYIFAHPSLDVSGIYEYNPKTLLFALLPDILKSMFYMHNIKATIIQKKFDHHAKMLIKILSPQVKYIDLITEDRESAQSFADKIYDITGLAIFVTNNICKTDKGAVIILDNIECKFHREAVIFDISANFRARPSNRIISKVNVDIPQELIQSVSCVEMRLDKQMIEKIILTSLCRNAGSPDEYMNIRNNFHKLGFKIQT